ncbi:Guanine nucleotide-binding protein subunit alpha-13 [Blastocladiella emersonii ATCC 22665]|nr:Guanine nucleotide-binding protein subunit alpha-13 [Blastocladiella emersonii ATCC 22665]
MTPPPPPEGITRAAAAAARKLSAEIDRQLKAERKTDEEFVKLLLLGTTESGKSTVLKQLKLINHGTLVDKDAAGAALPTATAAVNGETGLGAGMMDMDAWAGVIRGNLYDALLRILDYCAATNRDLGKPASAIRTGVDLLRNGAESAAPTVVDALQLLLADKKFVGAMREGLDGKFQLLDSAITFIENAATILAANYVPTNEHILLARLPTSAITETRINFNGMQCKIYDVVGAHNKRHAWLPFFDSCTCVLFVAALSGYDVPLPEDPVTNRLQEGLAVFEQVANHPLMTRTGFIVFLNKIDVFKDKLERSPIKRTFPDYTGDEGSYEGGCEFFGRKFLLLNRAEDRKMYVHFTWATQTSQIKVVLNTVQKIIIKINLAMANLV